MQKLKPLLATVLLLTLVGCGQRGPLYLPKQSATPEQQQAAHVAAKKQQALVHERPGQAIVQHQVDLPPQVKTSKTDVQAKQST